MEIAKRGMWNRLGIGNCTLFWREVWTVDQSLKDKFPSLFQYLSNKIIKMQIWGSGMMVCGSGIFFGAGNYLLGTVKHGYSILIKVPVLGTFGI